MKANTSVTKEGRGGRKKESKKTFTIEEGKNKKKEMLEWVCGSKNVYAWHPWTSEEVLYEEGREVHSASIESRSIECSCCIRERERNRDSTFCCMRYYYLLVHFFLSCCSWRNPFCVVVWFPLFSLRFLPLCVFVWPNESQSQSVSHFFVLVSLSPLGSHHIVCLSLLSKCNKRRGYQEEEERTKRIMPFLSLLFPPYSSCLPSSPSWLLWLRDVRRDIEATYTTNLKKEAKLWAVVTDQQEGKEREWKRKRDTRTFLSLTHFGVLFLVSREGEQVAWTLEAFKRNSGLEQQNRISRERERVEA